MNPISRLRVLAARQGKVTEVASDFYKNSSICDNVAILRPKAHRRKVHQSFVFFTATIRIASHHEPQFEDPLCASVVYPALRLGLRNHDQRV